MKALLAVAAVLVLSSVIATSLQVEGGKDIIIIGIGNNTSGEGRPPTFDISYPGPSPTDPSQYRSPATNVTPPPVPPEPDTELNWSSRRKTAPILFEMNGEVEGIGRFSEWREISEMAGLDAKQTSSATYGEFFISRRLLLISDKLDFNRTESKKDGDLEVTVREQWPTYIASNDYVNFLGVGYRGRERYSNNGDLVQSKFESGDILKESIYVGGLDNALIKAYVSNNGTIEDALYNKTTKYSIEAEYAGIFNLNMHMLSDNAVSVISEDYTGIMNIRMNMINRESFNESEPFYDPLCLTSSPTEIGFS
jgi:hypothetical protein